MDEREIVRRAVERQTLPEPAYERLLRRRDRKRRNQRLTAGAVAIVVFVGAMWFLAGRFSDRPPTPASRPKPVPKAAALAYWVDGDIYVADRDGSNPVRIADGVQVESADECGQGERRADYVAFGTAWSPDGRYLAYWDRGCPYGLPSVPPERGVPWGRVIISDPGGNVVASFPGQGWQISWSPDSKRVAISDFWSPGGSQGDATIGVYGLDGRRQAALTVPSELVPSGDYSPIWSRDGSSVLLRGVQVPLDGRTPPRRSPANDYTWGAAYSPDGSHLAYAKKGAFVVAEADESDAQKPGGPTEFWEAAWSPSGDRVAYVHDETALIDDSSPTELRMRDVATGKERSLVKSSGSQRLRVIEFSPDGDRILFKKEEDNPNLVGSLWSIKADGSDARRLVSRIEWADWRPTSPAP